MQDIIIRSLSLTGNCMQSEGELRFCISLYEIFVNLNFRLNDSYNAIEEYDPQINEWCKIGKINSHEILFYRKKEN